MGLSQLHYTYIDRPIFTLVFPIFLFPGRLYLLFNRRKYSVNSVSSRLCFLEHTNSMELTREWSDPTCRNLR
jgi:hypothetical protein